MASQASLAVGIVIISVFVAVGLVLADTGDLATGLMLSTFKLELGSKLGTCFVMGEPSPHGSGYSYFVLMTAAHLFQNSRQPDVTVHFRTEEDGTYRRVRCRYPIRESGKPLWTEHPVVDVAAIRIAMPSNVSVTPISTDLFASDSLIADYGIHPGDRLSVLGYPRGVESNKAGFPVLRSGYVASYPLIPCADTRTFLMDFRVFSGNSGGPVFYEDRISPFSGTHAAGTLRMVMGLVSTQLSVTETVRSMEEVSKRTHQLSLAHVVHAQFLREVLGMLPPVSASLKPIGLALDE